MEPKGEDGDHKKMTTGSASARSRFNVGDKVAAITDIEGVWNPPIRKGAYGHIRERAAHDRFLVHFDGHRTQLVEGQQLELPGLYQSKQVIRRRRWFGRTRNDD